MPTTTFSNFGDLFEGFVDAAAGAGLVPFDDVPSDLGQIEATLDYYGADAYRVNGRGESVTFARVIGDDERIDLKVTTPAGVIMIELSFPASRLGLRMFGECAAVQP